MNDAEKNLWQFYERIGRQTGYLFHSGSSCSVVTAPPGKWPAMVFNINPGEERSLFLEMMKGAILKNMLPGQFISNPEQFGPAHQGIMREYRFFPVDKWTLMEIYTGQFNRKAEMDKTWSVRKITDLPSLHEFSCIVNAVLLRILPVEAEMLLKLVDRDVSVFALFIGKELVSGMLVFTSGNIAGLYLVVTKKNRQHAGYGSVLLIETMNRLKSEGIDKIILQSSLPALPFYLKNGFSVTGEMYIYRYFV